MSNNRILTELPRYTEGRYKGKVNRQVMVGMNLKLLYNDEVYEVEVLEYIKKGNGQFFKIKYKNSISEISCGDFINSNYFGGVLKKKTKDFKIEIGTVLKDDKRDMTIIDRKYRKDRGRNLKFYKYRCNKCKYPNGDSYTNWISEINLLSGQKCGCCSNNNLVLGINTIWDTDRWMCDLGLSEQDAKTHQKRSNKNVIVICPYCNNKKEIKISNLYKNKSIGCVCGEKTSYPEAFMYNVLKQLNIKFKYQLTKTTFDWCENFRYDFYIPSINAIIETHGGQHYKDCSWSKAKDVQKNDRVKYELAIKNGINQYITIDCRKSELEWIENSILDSDLSKLFDLSGINWCVAHKFAISSNKIKEVCDYWNNKKEPETVSDLIKYFKKDRCTIIKYLKKGTELGWCCYSAKQGQYGINKRRVIAMYDLNGNFIIKESSAVKLKERCLKELNIDLSTSGISEVCSGKRKAHKGYIFKYMLI